MSYRILITNDDGYFSPGIRELAIQCEQTGYDVTIAAPNYDASGVSASLGAITAESPIKLEQPDIDGFEGSVYALEVPPATCVLIANLGAFGEPFDAVVSGINNGVNAGRSVLHSGTVGAALAAQNFGIRGLAVSIGASTPWYFQSAAGLAVDVLPTLLSAPNRTVLNLNVPGVEKSEIQGIRWAGLAPFNRIRSEIDKLTDDFLQLRMATVPNAWDSDIDLAVLEANYASLTSLQGTCEVWSDQIQPGNDFEPEKPVPSVALGDSVTPSRAFLPTKTTR